MESGGSSWDLGGGDVRKAVDLKIEVGIWVSFLSLS